jgi:hypothetical protein
MPLPSCFKFDGVEREFSLAGLALGALYEASARDLWCKLGEPVEREVAVKIARETFPHPPLRLMKPKPADEIPDDKERKR